MGAVNRSCLLSRLESQISPIDVASVQVIEVAQMLECRCFLQRGDGSIDTGHIFGKFLCAFDHEGQIVPCLAAK